MDPFTRPDGMEQAEYEARMREVLLAPPDADPTTLVLPCGMTLAEAHRALGFNVAAEPTAQEMPADPSTSSELPAADAQPEERETWNHQPLPHSKRRRGQS